MCWKYTCGREDTLVKDRVSYTSIPNTIHGRYVCPNTTLRLSQPNVCKSLYNLSV